MDTDWRLLAFDLCYRSHPRFARGRYRRHLGRTGDREGRRGHLEGSDGQCEHDGIQNHKSSKRHCGCRQGRGSRRPYEKSQGERSRRSVGVEKYNEQDGKMNPRL